MAIGVFVIYVTPGVDLLQVPQDWTTDYLSEPFAAREIFEDRFEDFDHEPTPEERAAVMGAGEFEAEGRWWSETLWRLRVRYPVTITEETRGGVVRLYTLADPKLPAGWGRKAVFWGVLTTVPKHLLLHNYVYTTLGFGPVAGAWAAVDPDDPTRFLDHAVQNATGLTNVQLLARINATITALTNLGYTPTELQAIAAAPAGTTEDDLIRALVADLGFTMAQLRNAAISLV